MKIDDRKWAPIFTSALTFTAAVGLGVAVVGGVIGTVESVEVGSMVFTVSLLCLYVVAQPKPRDKGEKEQTDGEQAPVKAAKKQKK